MVLGMQFNVFDIPTLRSSTNNVVIINFAMRYVRLRGESACMLYTG